MEDLVVAKGDVDEVMIMLRTVCGKFLGSVVFAMYDAVFDVLPESRNMFEVVKWVVVEEILM